VKVAVFQSDASGDASPQSAAQPSRGGMRSVILRAAAELFAARGYNATSVREVVERAGCTKPTLYYYFQNKEQLFLEALRDRTAIFTDVVDGALSRPGTVRERFRDAMRATVEQLRGDPITHRLLVTAERRPDHGQPPFDFEGVRQAHLEACQALLREGMATGETRADLNVEEAALAFFGMIDHRLAMSLQGRPLPEDYAEQAIDLFFRGVGA
jgi:TetR/AcrR family transcriptional regulator